MSIKIDSDLIDDINNPSVEVIGYCIKQHQAEIPRLDRLFDDYNGKHKILKRKDKNGDELTNIVVNHAKYVTDINVGFFLGNPISYSPGKDKEAKKNNDIDAVLEAFDDMDIISHDTELGKDLSVFGQAIELAYLVKVDDSNNTIPCIAKVDPRGMFLVVDDTVDSNPLFAVKMLEKFDLSGQSTGWAVDVYTKTEVINYKANKLDMKGADLIDTIPHYYGDVPAVEYRNNEERQGDFEQAMSLIDAYNVLQSDRINDKEAFIDAILVLYGFKLDETISKEDLEVLEVPNSQGEGQSKAEYLTKTFDESQIDILSKSIEDNIHKITYTPNLNDENFAGNISGEAMKYKLFGLLQLLSTKSRYMIKGLRQRLKLMQNILNTKGNNVNVNGTKIKIKPNLPINTSDIIDQITKAIDILPLETLLSWLPDIDDPEEEIQKLIEQKKKNMELQQQAMGDQSHADVEQLDDKEDEPGDNSDDQEKKQPD